RSTWPPLFITSEQSTDASRQVVTGTQAVGNDWFRWASLRRCLFDRCCHQSLRSLPLVSTARRKPPVLACSQLSAPRRRDVSSLRQTRRCSQTLRAANVSRYS